MWGAVFGGRGAVLSGRGVVLAGDPFSVKFGERFSAVWGRF